MAGESKMDPAKIAMIAISAVIILGVGAWLANYYGLIGGSEHTAPPPDITATMTEEEKTEFKKVEQEKQELIKKTPTSGS